MSDTPRTDSEAFLPHDSKYKVCDDDFARQLERELNTANDLIVRLQAITNDPHALWANWLRGDVKPPEGIGDVRQYQDRIKRLEEAGDYLCAAAAFMGWHDKIEAWNKAKEAK